MMAGTTAQPDGVPYAEVFRAVRSVPGAADGTRPDPAHADLVRFFRRLGVLTPGVRGPRAREAVEEAVCQMAASAGVAAEEVTEELVRFCAEGGATAVCTARPRCSECPADRYCAHRRRRPTIKDLPESERPRERLLHHGEEHLSDAELLAIIIGAGATDSNAIDLAQKLLADCGALRNLARRSPGELMRVHGIGPAKAARVRAALAIARRYACEPLAPGTVITGSRQVFAHMGEKLAGLQKECFIALLLDTKNRVVSEDQVAVGSLNESVVHPREVFKRAISESAAKVIFVHNHPSGNPEPSAQDRRLTVRLREVGDLVGIPVLDHVIVGRDTYFSFAEHGLLDTGA
jgi:DNA repair protein RadC